MSSIGVDISEYVATVTLDRPPVNAVDNATFADLRDTFLTFNDDRNVRVVIFTASKEDPPETATPVTVVHHPDGVELDLALGWLAEESGVRSVLCEGGPTLHGRLRESGLADELFLTIAPKIAGGEGPRILEGALADVDEVDLAWLLESGSELFARYRGMS